MPADARQLAEKMAGELLVGRDPRGASGLWQRMVNGCLPSGATGSALHALSALDIAIWDLKAKANNEPLWRTLGGSRPRINCHFSCADVASDANTLRTAGFRAAKYTVGNDPSAASEALAGIRDALQSNTREPSLVLDAKERWTPKEAVRAVRAIEEQFDIAWVEEPVQRWDFLGMKRVSDSIRAAVCSSGRLSAVSEYLPHLHYRSADVVQIHLQYGGITGALQLADAAFGFEIPVMLSAARGNIQTHVAAALPYCMSIEIKEAAPAGGVRIEGGWAVADDRPGHGLEVSGKSR
jgi:L-alanine-DL-glutamate epimerase-like enolase superfamily enzyme